MNINKLAFALSTGLMASTTSVFAAETSVPAAPPQTHDMRAAELPPMPGLYVSAAYGYRAINEITDGNGDAIFPDTDGSQAVLGFGALYVLPNPVGAGRMALYGVATMQNVEFSPGGPLPSSSTKGDWVDVVLGATWSKAHYRMPDGPPMGPPPGYAYSFGLEATIPAGDGSLGSLVISPNVAYTYRTDPIWLDGTEFSIRLKYNHVTERDSKVIPGLKYKDGDYIAADFAITERYKNFQFGIAGTYMKQIQDDKPGAGYPALPIGGGRMEEFVLGPVLNIDLGPSSAIKMKYTKGISSKNLVSGDLFQIGYMMKF